MQAFPGKFKQLPRNFCSVYSEDDVVDQKLRSVSDLYGAEKGQARINFRMSKKFQIQIISLNP